MKPACQFAVNALFGLSIIFGRSKFIGNGIGIEIVWIVCSKIVLNLISNASDAIKDQGPEIGVITLSTISNEPNGTLHLTVNGKTLDPAATYTLATNDFVARGGDGYAVFTEAEVLIDGTSARLMAAMVMDSIAAAGEVSPKVEGRVTAVD